MKPKLICSECSSEISKEDKFCPSCGENIEWDAGDCQGRTPDSGHSKKTDTFRSVKVVLTAAAVITAVFLILVYVVDREELPVQSGESSINAPGGAMEQAVITEIDRLKRLLDGNDADEDGTLVRLASLHHNIGRYEDAVSYYKRYIERNPDDMDVRMDLGICYFESGRIELSIDTMKHILSEDPVHQLAVFNLAIVYLHTGDFKTANDYFKAAYELNPDTETGLRARRIMEEHTF